MSTTRVSYDQGSVLSVYAVRQAASSLMSNRGPTFVTLHVSIGEGREREAYTDHSVWFAGLIASVSVAQAITN